MTTIPPSGTVSGTVILESPPSYVTSYEEYTGTAVLTASATTRTVIPPSGTVSGTIIVGTPRERYVTTTRAYTGTSPITAPTPVTTIPPNGNIPGTVIVEDNVYYVTSYTGYSGSSVLTAPITLTTIPPSDTVSGTVIIATPVSNFVSTPAPTASYFVTSYEEYSGTEAVTGDVTRTTVPASGTTPGTGKIIEFLLSCNR